VNNPVFMLFYFYVDASGEKIDTIDFNYGTFGNF
jgi:hypothetical protein